jgi:hypothetical protein
VTLIFGRDISVTEVAQNTVFTQEKELILTNDAWKIVVNLDLVFYEDVVAQLRDDLQEIYRSRAQFTTVKELQHVENLLNIVERDINLFKDILPRMDERRSLLNIVGTAFKILFGTATVADMQSLHNTVERLHENREHLAHSVNEQITYLKSLDHSVKFNARSVAILAEKVKGVMLSFQNWTDRADLTLHWINATIYNQTSLFTCIRELEFAILQLQTQIRDIMYGIENTLSGRLSMSLIPPETLFKLLKNVSLQLPDGYTMFAGLRKSNMHLYYEHSSVTILANHYSVKLIISVPLKTFDRHYVLYRVITLPFKVAKLGKYVQMIVEYPFLLIEQSQQRYLRWKESDLAKCKGNNFAVCPLEVAILSSSVLTCESSLFFQRAESRNLCRRRMMTAQYVPIFIRNSQNWIFSIGPEQQVNMKCLENSSWTTQSLTLRGNGILHNATSCHVVGREFQLHPAIRGYSYTTTRHQEVMVMQHVEPLSFQEIHQLQQISNSDIIQLNELAADAHSQSHDVNRLIATQEENTRLQQQHRHYWYWTIALLPLTLMLILCCYGKPCLISMVSRVIRPTKPSLKPKSRESPENTQIPSTEISPGEHSTHCTAEQTPQEFVTYPTHSLA